MAFDRRGKGDGVMPTVIIPAYKPDKTLGTITDQLWTCGCQIIVIDDGSGQEYKHIFDEAEDMLKLLEAARRHEKTLVLGVRDVGMEMPLKSRLGNRITRMVFKLVTGEKVSDTQTGLRAFGPELIPELLSVEGERYEYEMNMLMVCARKKDKGVLQK